jgi:Ni/Fe-hydrogenase subunit HybB-like protein
MSGFIYPNEGMIEWDLLIVIYPYITGLVAGAFVVSSLYHVFGLKAFKPVARLALLSALAFLLVTPMPLVVHLGHPEKALEMLLRPNLVSAMSGFGYIWFGYLLLVVAEVWLVFRPDIVRYAQSTEGIKRTVYSILALGVYDVSERALAIDHKLIRLLALIGIPTACLLHGYVGFIFGAVKANPWWSTPLMPVIFLLSAIVSGMAMQMVLYPILMRIRRSQVNHETMRHLALWLGGFLTLAFVLEGLEVFSASYESSESWEIISELLTEKLAVSYFGVQILLGSITPLIVLGVAEIAPFSERAKMFMRVGSAALILVGVFAMRWNVVIGGQLFSKSLRGFTEYMPPFLGEAGILVALIIMLLPIIIFAALVYLLPPWAEEAKEPEPRRLTF